MVQIRVAAIIDDVMITTVSRLPGLRPPDGNPAPSRPTSPTLSRHVLLAGAEFVYANRHRLSADDSDFSRGMVAVLTAGRTLTERQRVRLILLVDATLSNLPG